MQKKFTLFKTLLVAAGLLGGSSAWAAENMTTMTGLLGLEDNSTPAWTYYSKTVTLKAGETCVYTFTNYTLGSSATAEYQTWIAEVRENTTNYCLDARGDGGGWKYDTEPTNNALTYSYSGTAWNDDSRSLSDFMTAYNGVTVTLTISSSDDGKTITIERSATLNDGTTDFSGTWTCSGFAGNDKTINLIAESSHLIITNVHANVDGVEKNYALLAVDHTASSSRNGSNEITTTVDAEYEHYNNLKAAVWGGWAYAQFSYTIPTGYSIESATLTWATTIGGKSDTRNNDIYYVNAGTTIDYAGLASTDNLNPDATFILQVQKTAPATHTGIETDVTSAVRTLAATQDYVIFKWTNNAAGADLHGKASANAPTLELVTTAETFYAATFNANDGTLNPSVTVYSNEERTSSIAKDALSANTTYYYTATLAGYNDYEGSFAVESSDPTVNFTMTEKTRYTFTVNAVDANNNVIQAIYTDEDSYEGKAHTIVYPKYLTGAGNIVTYSKDNDTYGESKTAQAQNETYTVSYTAYDGVAYFVEVEDVVSATAYGSWNCSNGGAVRGFTTAKDVFTVPATGVYNITYAACNNNVSYDLSIILSKNGTKIATKSDLKSVSINYIKSTGIVSESNVSLSSGDVLSLTPSSTNGIIDYMLIELKSVPAVVTAAGYATFSSVYPLNLDEISGGTAYVVTSKAAGNTITLTEATGKVAAGTGLIIKGDAGTVTIPVAGSGEAVSGNYLVAVSANGTEVAAGNYILGADKDGDVYSNVGFYYLNETTTTLDAGQAYLSASVASEAKARLVFAAEDATGIANIEAGNAEENSVLYNVAGQQVTPAYKGIVIKNGKKYINK